ncbi:MAG: CYTH domain-containing protein [Paludibacteraceae bacterium]|nr:CYTH domain-containing protein [Paludibacteraceae bacterium]
MIYSVSSINNIEIERKFLVKDDSYKHLATNHIRIRQGYLCLQSNCSVRVRHWGEQAFLTIKSKINQKGFSRYEFEKEISVAEADELFRIALPGTIDKTRWLVPLADGLTCEVDEFFGDNQGLVMAEVELPDENMTFEHPAFLGEEVTMDRRYYNSYLSQHPFTTW